jgi:hypothetical protein
MHDSWSHAEEEFRQEIHDFLTAKLLQGWHDTLVLDKSPTSVSPSPRALRTKSAPRAGWQRIGPGVRWPESAQISEETRHGPQFDRRTTAPPG